MGLEWACRNYHIRFINAIRETPQAHVLPDKRDEAPVALISLALYVCISGTSRHITDYVRRILPNSNLSPCVHGSGSCFLLTFIWCFQLQLWYDRTGGNLIIKLLRGLWLPARIGNSMEFLNPYGMIYLLPDRRWGQCLSWFKWCIWNFTLSTRCPNISERAPFEVLQRVPPNKDRWCAWVRCPIGITMFFFFSYLKKNLHFENKFFISGKQNLNSRN